MKITKKEDTDTAKKSEEEILKEIRSNSSLVGGETVREYTQLRDQFGERHNISSNAWRFNDIDETNKLITLTNGSDFVQYHYTAIWYRLASGS